MAFNSVQIATNSSTTTALFVQGSGAGKLLNLTGSVTDPVPLLVKNMDASITIYIGSSTVSSSTGYPLLAGATFPIALINSGDILYGISASGTPNIAILAGRQ